jgi:hypothetical protein
MLAKQDLSYQEYPVNILETSESYPKYEDQDVQGVVEPSYRGKSYLGETKRIQGRVSKFLF